MTKSDLPSVVALVPARSGSKRVAGKNVRRLAGHPLLAYTIAAALQSEVFSSVVVSTDSPEYADIARHYGAEVPFLRPAELAGDLSPDIEWVEYTLRSLKREGRNFDCFSILRPTSPLRQAETIRRAWQQFNSDSCFDSLRAVEKCQQHPGKMWIVDGNRMVPLLPSSSNGQPWHSSQYQALPEVYVQNASLEIAWTRVVFELQTIAGDVLMPFFTQDYEGLDVNRPEEWQVIERLVTEGKANLPVVDQDPYPLGEHE
jgi:N-acylneuraminate cytidylyltransferase